MKLAQAHQEVAAAVLDECSWSGGHRWEQLRLDLGPAARGLRVAHVPGCYIDQANDQDDYRRMIAMAFSVTHGAPGAGEVWRVQQQVERACQHGSASLY